MTYAEIREAAMKLTPEERVELADVLASSLPEHYWTQVDAAWTTEIERREKAIEAGEVKSTPADEVFRQLRARH